MLKFETTNSVTEFVDLKAKQYAFAYRGSCKKSAEGISRVVVKTFNFETYRNMLRERENS